MKQAKLTLSALFLVSSIAGCDGGGGEYVKQMESFAEKTCACKDSACATKVQKEQADWLTANAEKAASLSSDDAEKVTTASSKLAKCVTDIATKEAGG